MVNQKFDLEIYPNALAEEGDEELTPRGEERGTQPLFISTARIPADRQTAILTGRLGGNL